MDCATRLHVLLTRSLEALPTPISRLVFLASLRDVYTGRYLHEGWASVSSEQEVNRKARELHFGVLRDVLGLPLAELCRELREHFQSLGGDKTAMARVWLELETFRELLPTGCLQMERNFFISQVKTALEVLVRSPNLPILASPVASLPQPPDPPLPRHRES